MNKIIAQPEFTISMLSISDAEFNEIRTIVYNKFGINLTEQKRSLVVGRLQGTIRTHGFKDFAQYLNYLKTDPTGQAISELVNQISTNHTFFYREKEHFEYLQSVALPEIIVDLKKYNQNSIRIWSAACSSGEEPYTIQMVIQDVLGQDYKSLDAGVLATDISEKVLNIAKQGIYPDEKLMELPQKYKDKYLNKVGNNFLIKSEIKKEVTFRRFNLMNKIFPFKQKFHVIFCRNVMIYFDAITRKDLINRLYEVTAPGGFLFIGHSESINRNESFYEYVKPAVYRRKK